MVRDEDVSFSLEVNVEKALGDLREVQTVLYRTIGLLRQLGLPKEVDAVIRKTQQLIAITNALRLALIGLYMSSGPVGWVLGAIGLASGLIATATFAESLYDETRGY